jgi:hypothetical protein
MAFSKIGAALLLGSLFALGCNDGPASSDEQDFTEVEPATISFDADFKEEVDGTLVDGGTAVLAYDDERVSECQAVQGGIPQYAVTAYYRIDGGKTKTIVVAGLNATKEPTIELDGAGELEVWFEATSKHGCHVWDSDFGNNYWFEVAEEE